MVKVKVKVKVKFTLEQATKSQRGNKSVAFLGNDQLDTHLLYFTVRLL